MTVQMTAEQFQEFLRMARNPAPANNKNFIHCTARFDGTRSAAKVEEFVTMATIYKNVENVTDENAITGLPLLLIGEASQWWNGVKNQAHTWDDAMSLIRKAYAPAKPNYQLFQEIFHLPQPDDMPVDRFITIQRDLLSRMSRALDEEWQIDIIFGLLKAKLRNRLQREEIFSFDALLSRARAIEAILSEGKKKVPENTSVQPQPKDNKKTRTRCEYCHNHGHTANECRKRQRNEPPHAAVASKVGGPEEIRCYGCNAPGVFRRNCPRCTTQTTPAPTATTTMRTNNVGFCAIKTQRLQPRSRPAVEITIANVTGTAFLDTAAGSSVASASLFHHLQASGHQVRVETVDATFADGASKTLTVPTIHAEVVLCGRKIATTFVSLSGNENANTLLGADFIEDAGLIPDLAGKKFFFRNAPNITFPLIAKDGVREIVARPETNIKVAQVRTTVRSAPPPKEEPMDTDNYGPPAPKRPVTTQPQGRWNIYMAPDSVEYMWADAVQATAELFPVSPHSQEQRPPVPLEFATLHLRLHEGTGFLESERAACNDLLGKYRDLFENSGPPTPFAEHSIETGTSAPVSVPPYRLTPQKKDFLKKEIDELIEIGIVEECDSPWAAPVVLVPKPDGTLRLCVDYRKLNAVTVPDAYPLPRMDDLLQSMGRIGCISTIDLQAGYWQVAVRKQDQDKTAFICPFGLFRFTRMPFGLRNAPATFQRLMDRFRAGLPDLTLLAYLDDLVLFSATKQEHLIQLERIFQHIRHFKLRMKREKCFFGCPEVRYLGHRISAGGIVPDPDKVQAIAGMPPPSNLKHAHTFLQTCSWFRRFIPNFANISKPLSDLLKKNAVWEWGPAQQEAFETLKNRLITAPILQQADLSKPFTLRTDASSHAIGAALLQGEENEERPIEYASRLLTAPEKNYSTTEREALAIVWAVNKFRGYIEENTTVVITDHQPLRWLMSLKSPTGRLARWALQLQPFDLTIQYTPGRANVLADLLSRPQCDAETKHVCSICMIHIDVPVQGALALREEQMRDPEVRQVIDALTTANPEIAQPWTAKGYVINQGVLYHYPQEGDDEEAQLVVPVHDRPRILKEFHDAPTAGHYGVARTLHKISSRYYWPGMRRYVTDYLKTCLECQRYKPSNVKPAGLLQTPVLQQRMEVLSVDLFGPLPPSEDGKKWILIAQDYATKWVELFALADATAENCGWTIVNEIGLRYGLPRRIISDNGSQFISAVMQKITFCLGITQSLTPVYHPEANPVERRNRDLKTQLSIQIGEEPHPTWPTKLPAIRFAMNTARCQTTNFTPAYLMFGREPRTVDDVTHDLRSIVVSENFVAEATPKLLRLADTLEIAREQHESEQTRRKRHADLGRQPSPEYQLGDLVLVSLHQLSNARQGVSSKLLPRRDGPYAIRAQKGPTSYELESLTNPSEVIGTYHTSQLKKFHGPVEDPPAPVAPVRRRGRPRKHPIVQAQ
jgi:hypothetical protein